MERSLKSRLSSLLTAAVMAAELGAYTNEALAEKDTSFDVPSTKISLSQQGQFLDTFVTDEGKVFGTYAVKEGDHTSKISERICVHYGEEPQTKYWPVIAFYNGFPRVLQPGDLIIFPASMEEMENARVVLEETGWTNRYKYKNDVYGRRKGMQGKTTLYQLLVEIYGEKVCVDPDFVDEYLKTKGLYGKYTMETIIDADIATFVRVTEWIPSLEQIKHRPKNVKKKTKKKNQK